MDYWVLPIERLQTTRLSLCLTLASIAKERFIAIEFQREDEQNGGMENTKVHSRRSQVLSLKYEK
jgi:hypothetical protein